MKRMPTQKSNDISTGLHKPDRDDEHLKLLDLVNTEGDSENDDLARPASKKARTNQALTSKPAEQVRRSERVRSQRKPRVEDIDLNGGKSAKKPSTRAKAVKALTPTKSVVFEHTTKSAELNLPLASSEVDMSDDCVQSSEPAESMISTKTNKSKLSLLDLPREIRQEIFTYLLPYTKPDEEEPSGVVWVKRSTTLLSVCKQLYDEYACFMYMKNTWCFTITSNNIYLRTWVQEHGKVTKLSGRLAKVKTQQLEYMRNVVIRIELTVTYLKRKNPNVIGEVQAQVAAFVEKLSQAFQLDSVLIYIHDWHGKVQDILTVLKPFHNLSNMEDEIQVSVAPLWAKRPDLSYAEAIYGEKQPSGKKDKRVGDSPWFEEMCSFEPGGKMDEVFDYFTSRKDKFARFEWHGM